MKQKTVGEREITNDDFCAIHTFYVRVNSLPLPIPKPCHLCGRTESMPLSEEHLREMPRTRLAALRPKVAEINQEMDSIFQEVLSDGEEVPAK